MHRYLCLQLLARRGSDLIKDWCLGVEPLEPASTARLALESAGMRVLQERDVLVQKLRQDEPGQLGKICRGMAEAGVNIEVLYSDHDHHLILVVDDLEKGRTVSELWMRERPPSEKGNG